MLQLTFNNGIDVIQRFLGNDWVKQVKATSVSQGSFNNMEGYQYTITVKVSGKTVSPTQRYKGRMFQILTNSSYMEELMENTNNPLIAFNDYIDSLVV